MNKEIINSFSDGLIKDLNELSTPNKVLTDCLNGTLVTFNGNEFSLQNDMGNAKVGTAYLRDGYVPVGMKEHGGIIYVASYNPVTKKSQIGSFPSPQRLFYKDNYKDNNGNDISVNLQLDNILKENNGVILIEKEFARTPITDSILHQGDRFVLKFADGVNIDSIIDLIDKNILKVKLAVLSKDGKLEYIKDDTLKVSKLSPSVDFWAYKNDDIAISTVLSEKSPSTNNYLQIFNSSYSGKLYLIYEYHTFDTMSVSHSFSKSNDSIVITTTVNVTPLEDSTATLKGIFELNKSAIYKQIAFTDKETYTLSYEYNLQNNGSITSTIYPASKFGVLKRLEYTYSFDYNEILEGLDELTNFTYEYKEGYLVINWGYNYINLDDDKQIGQFKFDFLKFDSPTKEEAVDTINIVKDSYTGFWTETINIRETSLNSNDIYICKISKTYKDGTASNKVYYKTVFTSEILNTTGYNPIDTISLDIEPSIELKKTSYNFNDYLYKDNNWKQIESNSQNLVFGKDAIPSYMYRRNVNVRYTVEDTYTVKDEFKINNNTFRLSDLNLTYDINDDRNYQYTLNRPNIDNESLNNILNGFSDTISSTNENITLSVHRAAYSPAILSDNSKEITTLEPMYKPNTDNSFLANSNDNVIKVIGGQRYSDKAEYYMTELQNSSGNILSQTSVTTSPESIVNKIITGSNKVNELVSAAIFTGLNSDLSSLRVYNSFGSRDGHLTNKTRQNGGYSWHKDGEFDGSFNYMILYMRTNKPLEDGSNWILCNLASKRSSEDFKYSKLPNLIATIFSQILLPVKKYVEVVNTVPDFQNYVETVLSDTLKTTITNINADIKYNDNSYSTLVKTWKEQKKDSDLFFPEFKTDYEISKEFNIGENYLNDEVNVKSLFQEASSGTLVEGDLTNKIDTTTLYLPTTITGILSDGSVTYEGYEGTSIKFPRNTVGNTNDETGISLETLRDYFVVKSSEGKLSSNNTIYLNADVVNTKNSNIYSTGWVEGGTSLKADPYGPNFTTISFGERTKIFE